MKSVYIKVLWLSFGILVFALGGFLYISRTMTHENFAEEAPIGRNANTQFEEAKRAYQSGGKDAVAEYLGTLHTSYPRLQFYFAKNSRDLVNGADRSRLLGMAKSRWSLVKLTGPLIVAIPSP